MDQAKANAEWVASLERPEWDDWFMSLVFVAARRSPDRETKVGAVLVDWPTKRFSVGYNGHPRGTEGLPDSRPDKYPFMVHADVNALLNFPLSHSDDAVMYLPFPPCEVCLGIISNHPDIRVRRIVYAAHRDYENTNRLLDHLPHIVCEQYLGGQGAEHVLEESLDYLRLMMEHGPSTGGLSRYRG